ncbi:peptide chain release factor N(5)-glutamine methyltransferase [Candidatus Vallotia cooleyia]|uniref:peptide chain release factor N(5)-glutamine methyltransferase n=1 Tax=Candidatus Vallotiella adelgis TaxID=1177211 RepID=UPI001D01AC84|nr:peptide chain release factor N(5)-glutamine methyltransferase [Candidatus Vallotia cooleyia]UDG82242.1 Release factor glutamine methyltransferase [Candidatus Vallotia cooleyia]
MTNITKILRSSPLNALEAQILLAHVLNWPRTMLITRADNPLPDALLARFLALQSRRIEGEPIAQLVGSREFFGLNFDITPYVLIPRPETELLVEWTLNAVQAIPLPHILDLGTGSGAIAIAIAHSRPDTRIIATDRCAIALAVACRNVRRLLGEAALSLVSHHHLMMVNSLAQAYFMICHGNWFDALSALHHAPLMHFDAIVSNPPYIAASDPHLREGDLRFEPLDALTDHADGLSAIRSIIVGSVAWLAPGGTLCLEHGFNQAESVRSLFEKHGFNSICCMRDLAGIERVTCGSR